MSRKHVMVRRIIGMVIAGLIVACLLGLALGYLVMSLWNALMPQIFGLPVITYWQAVGLFILSHLLIKGFGHHSHKESPKKHGRPGTDKDSEAEEKFVRWIKGEEVCCGRKKEPGATAAAGETVTGPDGNA